MKFSTGANFIQLFLSGDLEFVVNGSFYPTKSYLILAAWFALIGKKVVARADFITSVAEEYHHPFLVELYGALSILICINSILSRYPYPSKAFTIQIGSNCSGFLDTLWITSLVITILRYLQQVIREILLIKRK